MQIKGSNSTSLEDEDSLHQTLLLYLGNKQVTKSDENLTEYLK